MPNFAFCHISALEIRGLFTPLPPDQAEEDYAVTRRGTSRCCKHSKAFAYY